VSDTIERPSLTPISGRFYADCVLKPRLASLRLLPLLAALSGACDRPVTVGAPVPPGQIGETQSALRPPVDTLGGPVGTADIVISDCTTDGCALSTNPCYDYVCNASNGACEISYHAGVACNDGNACTTGDKCAANGACTPGTAKTCTASDQCHDVGTCDPASGVCSNPAKAESSPCNDQNACSKTDVCQGGVCKGTNLVVCTASDQCHNAGTCDATSGTCSNPGKADNSPCDDQNACTKTDTCQGAVCKPGTAVVCTASDQCHDVGTCDTTTGTCSNPAKPAGFTCNDGMTCTYSDACNAAGACVGKTISCVSDAFAERSCNGTQTCTVVPKAGAACDDHNPCTKGDVLDDAGKCAGMAYTCTVGDCMTANACDGQGGCVPAAKPDGTDCDADHSKCTPNDRCKAGLCVRDPSPVTCVPKDCNSVSCNPTTGNCDYAPTSGGTCGVTGCYTMGTCANGKCSGTPKDCTAMDGACAQGVCDATTGQCMSAPKPNGMSCDPGGKCGTGAQCAFGTCELAASTCPASKGPCKVPSCDPGTGACSETNRPAGTPCDPQTACLTGGVCDESGECQGAPAPNGDSCTTKAGEIGLCAAGECTPRAQDGVDAGASGSGGGGGSGGAAGTGGKTTDASADKPKTMSSGGGCTLAGDSSLSSPAGLLLALAALLARRRR
jgi:hypothetical protein